VADVDDARRVAQQLGIAHHVFNFTDEFDRHVVGPYVDAHRMGHTPNPCIECNRHLKFDRFLRRASQLGFDAVATGHHARVVGVGGRFELRRGADAAKDQSYVLSMLDQASLSRTLLPVGEFNKTEVRRRAAELGLRTASKADSQDVCFILASKGRRSFLADRMPLHRGEVVDAASGEVVGEVDAVELVTVGQRRGLGGGNGVPRFAVSVDVAERRVVAGEAADLDIARTELRDLTWVDAAPLPGTPVRAQISAHAPSVPATFTQDPRVGAQWAENAIPHRHVVLWGAAQRRVAPGQTVALYDEADERVLGAGIAT
jgi:tRNA-specific 2-thiouridylase